MMRVLAFLTFTMHASSAPIDGNPGCKCNSGAKDHVPKVDCTFEFETATHEGKCVQLDTEYGTQAWHIYPADYGNQCQIHHEYAYKVCTNESTMVEGSKPPKRIMTPSATWCNDVWCYIDACKCDTPDIAASSAFQSHGVELKYSYAACGAVDGWTNANTDKKTGDGACEVDTSGGSALHSSALFASLLVVTTFF